MCSLKLNEPGVHQQLASFVNTPDSHGPIRGASHEQLHFLYVHHVQDTASVPDDCLEAFVLSGLRLPQLDRAIGRC